MSNPNILGPVKLPSDLATQLKGAVDEALKSLGNEAAVLEWNYRLELRNSPISFAKSKSSTEEHRGPTCLTFLEGTR